MKVTKEMYKEQMKYYQFLCKEYNKLHNHDLPQAYARIDELHAECERLKKASGNVIEFCKHVIKYSRNRETQMFAIVVMKEVGEA